MGEEIEPHAHNFVGRGRQSGWLSGFDSGFLDFVDVPWSFDG